MAINPAGTKAYVTNAGNNDPATSSVFVYNTTSAGRFRLMDPPGGR
ncbi:hypothetical protein [Streptomyces sp. NPDC094472]